MLPQVAEATWAETFKYLADNNVLFEGILLKPSMVTPGAEHKKKATPEEVRPGVHPTRLRMGPAAWARGLGIDAHSVAADGSRARLGAAAGCLLHPEDAAPPRAPRRARHHVPVW